MSRCPSTEDTVSRKSVPSVVTADWSQSEGREEDKQFKRRVKERRQTNKQLEKKKKETEKKKHKKKQKKERPTQDKRRQRTQAENESQTWMKRKTDSFFFISYSLVLCDELECICSQDRPMSYQ